MAPRVPSTASAPPDSPPPSHSPAPTGIQGELEVELLELANALYNLGTTVINDSTKEKPKPGQPDNGFGGKPVGQRVNDVIGSLITVEDLAARLPTMIPMQVLQDVDNAKNPMNLTRDRLERAATENQFMNGKIQAIDSYRKMLDTALATHFPELGPYLAVDQSSQDSTHEDAIKSEP
ncbi:hypothetical protein BD410DRAFT_779504 [Rickenella mellea]|uniref:Mediator of RNA polymerase II transcription subunit 10 n=1 Tax=Rickenella mellea TaxID=50990 RepID=A0A4V3AZI1_9AGAM|nr:hypothetical protein BD410DRAFT_779504 [Rickenella mellea]